MINGKSKDSDKVISDIQSGKLQYVIIKVKSGNAALDFPKLNNIIYYSLPDSHILFEQSKFRVRRIGQLNVCNYYYLIIKGTVDRGRLRNLQKKKSFNDREYLLYKKEESK